jgi:OOP family OmpA-OmpF porin
MMRFALPFLAILLSSAGVASSLELDLPSNARNTAQIDTQLDSYVVPIGPFRDGAMQTRTIEGRVGRSAWRINSPGVTPLQILGPLRTQLNADGYNTVLDCDQTTCGGFDFRFGTEVLSAPDMFVNIRSFRFLTVLKGDADAPTDGVSLLVSTSDTEAFVQIIQAGQSEGDKLQVATQAAEPAVQVAKPVATTNTVVSASTSPAISLEATLLSKGAVVLDGLDFATGTSDLGEGPFAILQELSAFFKTRDDIQLLLVGHTDSVGSLDFNIQLSKQRAASVRKRLLDAYGLDAERVFAEGNGYLSPIMSNLSRAGRTANRRVEAVVLPLAE